MTVVYKNTNDSYNLHYGNLLTDPGLVNEHSVYIDIIPNGSIIHSEPDWKNTPIASVNMEDIVRVYDDERTSFKDDFPELYFL